jgi:N6-adenosine-specific RNA methylase IME4
MMKFNAIMADPPWQYGSPKAIVGNGGRGNKNITNIVQVDVNQHYQTMSVKDIKALPISNLSYDNSFLFLWMTNAFCSEAHDIAKCWGFEPKTIITWGKIQKDNPTKVSMKTGYWFRGTTEHLLFCVKGHPKRPKNFDAIPTLFLHQRLPHSVKPDLFYELVEKVSPGPYLELFARRKRDRWHCWGNEIENDLIIK